MLSALHYLTILDGRFNSTSSSTPPLQDLSFCSSLGAISHPSRLAIRDPALSQALRSTSLLASVRAGGQIYLFQNSFNVEIVVDL